MAASADEGAADAASEHERVAVTRVVVNEGRATEAEGENREEDHGEEDNEDEQGLCVECYVWHEVVGGCCVA